MVEHLCASDPKIKKLHKAPMTSVWHIIRAWCKFYFGTMRITKVTVFTFLGQSDQVRCQNVLN